MRPTYHRRGVPTVHVGRIAIGGIDLVGKERQMGQIGKLVICQIAGCCPIRMPPQNPFAGGNLRYAQNTARGGSAGWRGRRFAAGISRWFAGVGFQRQLVFALAFIQIVRNEPSRLLRFFRTGARHPRPRSRQTPRFGHQRRFILRLRQHEIGHDVRPGFIPGVLAGNRIFFLRCCQTFGAPSRLRLWIRPCQSGRQQQCHAAHAPDQ